MKNQKLVACFVFPISMTTPLLIGINNSDLQSVPIQHWFVPFVIIIYKKNS